MRTIRGAILRARNTRWRQWHIFCPVTGDVAARALHGDNLDQHLVARLNRIVTSWVETDPLCDLERALRALPPDRAG